MTSLVGLQLLQNLLYITPRSAFVEEIVHQTLANVQLCLLVDGFDEVMEEYQKRIIKFLQHMWQNAARCALVIATRDEALPHLKQAFNKVANYKLATFPYEKYFRQLWLSEPSEITPDLEKNVQIFLSDFDKLLKGAGCKTFLEVPQLCKIMGTIYQDHIRKPNMALHVNYEIGSIYDKFVKSQLENTLRGQFDETKKLHVWAKSLIEKEYYTKHAQLAYELESNRLESKVEQYEEIQRFGLIMIQFDSSKSVHFMHRTVMDYFLVRSYMLDVIETEEFILFLQRYWCVSRANIADKFIDFFLADGECLSLTKKYIIKKYLTRGSDVLPTFIRRTLNNATFNTLTMLLSVAPIENLEPLSFRFGGTYSMQGNTTKEINLKRLGERQTLLLLDALKRRDDEHVVDDDGAFSMLERMLFEENLNEEDTMEVAIRKPFPDVFDRVVKYCTDHFNEQIQRYLMKRIPRYARAAIRHCYAEKKEKIIDKLLQLCENSFPAESVQEWLQSFDLLEELIVSIEEVPQGKQFKEVDRLDLTRKVLEMLDRYLTKEYLITLKERSRERVEKVQNEAIKSVLQDWMNVEE
uniref:NACHT domain-containing protein n=1 Tax=Anopheles funestus TaxID=62324 RepID=A0A4Y0BG43_ANOFN